MSDAPALPDDFEQTYDMPDPRPYFGALRPLDYRMPRVVCSFLRQFGATIAAARGEDRLLLADFACGYGANGLLLQHEITLSEIHDHYLRPLSDDFLAADAAFFAARRQLGTKTRIIGIDIAAEALAYAKAVGAVDEAFAVNLVEEDPDPSLARLLTGADLIIESGAIGALLAPAMARILDTARGERRPWLLLAPRGDVDDSALRGVLAANGYRVEHCNQRPFRYRRFMGQQERQIILDAVTALGRDPALWLDDDYFLINLWLARPEADCRLHPIEAFVAEDLGQETP
jgi:SAM-dependent methyltransferase